MVANFGDRPDTILIGQKVAATDLHPSSIIETNISHGEVFGIEENEKLSYKKRNLDARDTTFINKHLADLRESHMQEDET